MITDTIHGVFYGQAVNPSISASYSPQIFGMFLFTNPNSRLQSIRHVIKPSIGFSFVPKFAGLSSNMYRQPQIDSATFGNRYSIYEGNIFGTPSSASKSGTISLGLVNIVEGKIFARNDTTGKPKKIKIIDNFSINTGYNIFADSIRWSAISVQMRTTIFEKINISTNSSFSLYGLNDKGTAAIGTFLFNQTGKLMRLTNFGTSLDFSLSELLKGNKGKNKTGSTQNSTQRAGGNDRMSGQNGPNGPNPQNAQTQSSQGGGKRDQYGYLVFDVPWSLNVSYSLNYSKPGFKSNISQTLSCNGNVSVTKKMSITYTTGYDFKGKQITMTQIGMTRDLHCWTMLLNWVPNGTMQSWNFTIRVKASVLGDLKYERRKDYHDTY